jgi:hypothetical protein
MILEGGLYRETEVSKFTHVYKVHNKIHSWNLLYAPRGKYTDFMAIV